MANSCLSNWPREKREPSHLPSSTQHDPEDQFILGSFNMFRHTLRCSGFHTSQCTTQKKRDGMMIFLIILRYLHLYYVKVELIDNLDITKKISCAHFGVTRKTKFILNCSFSYFSPLLKVIMSLYKLSFPCCLKRF